MVKESTESQHPENNDDPGEHVDEEHNSQGDHNDGAGDFQD
jgi:hypothetical protein